MGGLDDFPDHTGAKGGDVRDDQLLVCGRSCGGQELRELFQTQSGDDGHDVRVVAEVEVEGLVENEGAVHFVQGSIDLCTSWGQVVEVALETGVDLFDVGYTGGTPCGGCKTIVAVELHVDAVLEALPFGIAEEVAEFRVPIRNGFVGAEGLCLRRVSGCQIGRNAPYIVSVSYSPIVVS